jgi:uncharacterized protein involved in exopolysaccharide biosynthesis
MMAVVIDPEAEREVDLRRWWRALVRRWWIVVVGLVVGAVVGGLFSLSGGSTYEATAIVAPGQAFNPSGGTAVLTYLTNQAAVNEIATSEATLQEAAALVGVPASKLHDQVSTQAVTEGGVSAARALLVDIKVRLPKRTQAEEAADAIARIVARDTTSPYVKQSLSIYAKKISNFNERLKTLQNRINLLAKASKQPGLTLNEQLLLAIQLDQAQATQGNTIDTLSTTQQQQILSQDVEQTQIVQAAKAAKTQARSKRTSVVVGALIGLIVGAIVAIVVGLRASSGAALAA